MCALTWVSSTLKFTTQADPDKVWTHFEFNRRLTLGTASKIFSTWVITEYTRPPRFSLFVGGIPKRHSSTILLPRDTHIARTSLGPNRTLLYSTLSSVNNDVLMCSEKKNFNILSTHYTLSQTSTSAGIIFETIWLILIGSIWLHMSQNIWIILTYQSESQQKQFLMRLCPSTHDKSWQMEIWKISLSLNSGHRQETQEKQREYQKVVLTEIVTQSLPFYNKNTSSTKVYDQGANR